MIKFSRRFADKTAKAVLGNHAAKGKHLTAAYEIVRRSYGAFEPAKVVFLGYAAMDVTAAEKAIAIGLTRAAIDQMAQAHAVLTEARRLWEVPH